MNALLAQVSNAEQADLRVIFAVVTYVLATVLFVLALKWLSAPHTARRGNLAGEIGMGLAILGALCQHGIISYEWIIVGFVVGAIIGAPMAIWMPMTAVPQRTALSHACGALAAALVGSAHYYLHHPRPLEMAFLCIEVLLGSLTFTGSLMAAGKLQDWLPGRPMTYKNQNVLNLSLLGAAVLCGVLLTIHPGWSALFPILIILALIFGVLLILPIGGADMPTVIALLNSYAGLSASMMGFVLDSKLLIIAGALDGASGFILSIIMCRAMNRSFTNVLFGAFGQVQPSVAGTGEKKTVRSAGAEEVAAILGAAQNVIVIPGYGMAVAQAQHKVRELYDQLSKRGVNVKFAIHPVAGRMPGHMNVLLAEAEIPYDRLVEMDEINGDFPQCDVALVVGANDVVNPAARHDKSSPIYGMPILNADKARTVIAIKRSMNPGFAGIDNELYTLDRTLMLFGDAKAVIGATAKELAESNGH
ncbi:MAG TPA: NAD(P)(+) transhydrogenase (Re/Si-specific) subunit beta [Tepidisphaeraceae bacterium]|nr:NAD(P)(+) transhydrogenase (Re/Si-specific) subunit beta [Tepidisphaeraceae bacterium]